MISCCIFLHILKEYYKSFYVFLKSILKSKLSRSLNENISPTYAHIQFINIP